MQKYVVGIIQDPIQKEIFAAPAMKTINDYKWAISEVNKLTEDYYLLCLAPLQRADLNVKL